MGGGRVRVVGEASGWCKGGRNQANCVCGEK